MIWNSYAAPLTLYVLFSCPNSADFISCLS